MVRIACAWWSTCGKVGCMLLVKDAVAACGFHVLLRAVLLIERSAFGVLLLFRGSPKAPVGYNVTKQCLGSACTLLKYLVGWGHRAANTRHSLRLGGTGLPAWRHTCAVAVVCLKLCCCASHLCITPRHAWRCVSGVRHTELKVCCALSAVVGDSAVCCGWAGTRQCQHATMLLTHVLAPCTFDSADDGSILV